MILGSDVLADVFARGEAALLRAVGLPNSGCGDSTWDGPLCFAGGLEGISIGDFSLPAFEAGSLAWDGISGFRAASRSRTMLSLLGIIGGCGRDSCSQIQSAVVGFEGLTSGSISVMIV